MAVKLDYIKNPSEEDLAPRNSRGYEYWNPLWVENEDGTVDKSATEVKEVKAPLVFKCNLCDESSEDEEVIKEHVKTCKPKEAEETVYDFKEEVTDEPSGDGGEC